VRSQNSDPCQLDERQIVCWEFVVSDRDTPTSGSIIIVRRFIACVGSPLAWLIARKLAWLKFTM
jgi:hypothetical protein